MGVFDMARLAQKAMKAKSQMSKLQAAGRSGSVAMIIDGLYTTLAVEIDVATLKNEINLDIDENTLAKITKNLEQKFVDASKDARKALESELSKSTSLDDLKNILQDQD